jgi:hypothetical protein
MKYILGILLSICCTISYAQNRPWTDTENKLFIAHTALVIADWSQTRYIAKNPNSGYVEVNPLFGKHPHKDKVDILFLASLIGTYYAFDYADSNRENMLITATIVRGAVVGHNLNIGVRIGF